MYVFTYVQIHRKRKLREKERRERKSGWLGRENVPKH
jgi:hypothetical protein